MASGSPISLPDDPKGDDQPVRKRKRTTLSCLQCVKRKAKCDKVHPCSTCISRKEAHLCEFEDGAAPAPAQASVSIQEFMALKARLDNLEGAPKTITPLQNTPTSLEASPIVHCVVGKTKTEDLETTLTTIEGLAAGSAAVSYLDQRLQSPATPATPCSAPWPRVTLPNTALEARSAKWVRDMTEALARIPDRQTLRVLVDFFFEECLMTRIYVYRSLFEKELEGFEELRASGKALKVDPGWLALLASILWASLITMHNSPNHSPLPKQAYDNIAEPLVEAFDTALACAEWIGKPQLRVLFALIITIPPHGPIPFTQRDLKWEGRAFRSMWFDVALSTAKALGIHVLGKDKPLPDDPMLPTHLPALARQLCTQAFHAVWLYDTFMFCGRGDIRTITPFIIQDGTCDTAELINYREADLMTMPHPPVRSKFEMTWDSMSIHKYRLGVQWRKIIEGLRAPDSFSYEALLRIDRDLRSSTNTIANLVTAKELLANEAIMFDFLQSSYQFRLLRLHRPFYLQSFTDPRFHFTRITIVDAAREITKANRRLLTRYSHRPAVQHALYLCVHHLGALVVLFLHALLDPRSRDEMRDEIRLSLDVMIESDAVNHAFFQRVGSRGIKAATVMLDALSDKRPPLPTDNIEEVIKNVLLESVAPDPPVTSEASSLESFSFSAEEDLEILLNSWTSMQPSNLSLAAPIINPQNVFHFPEPKNTQDMELDWSHILRGF